MWKDDVGQWWAGFAAAFGDQVTLWGRDRWWWPRAALLAAMAYLGLCLTIDATTPHIFAPVNLGIHETGHVLFSFTGIEFVTIAGGTLAQILAPLVVTLGFLRQPDYFAPAFGGFWLGTNLSNISVYIADARARALPLVTVGGGDTIIHDWHFMLGKFGLLSFDRIIGFGVWALSIVVMAVACLYGVWVCVLIARGNRTVADRW